MTNPTETAILAGGCFWGMQDLLRRYPGVLHTRVGYTGGDVPNATYRNHGNHAEAIEIVFDPAVISYRQILEFFKTQIVCNRPQGGLIYANFDIGVAYLVFLRSDQTRAVVTQIIKIRTRSNGECRVLNDPVIKVGFAEVTAVCRIGKILGIFHLTRIDDL